MTKSKSSVVIREGAPPTVAPGDALVLARGGHDAHLRLAVLLAASAAPPGSDQTRALSPCASWTTRRDALLNALSGSMAKRVVLVDPDAAWAPPPRGNAVFDDAACASERSTFFQELLRHGAQAGWTFVRTAPKWAVTNALAEAGIPAPTRSPAVGSRDHLPGLPPALQPLAQWLVSAGRVARGDLVRLLDAAEGDEDRCDALISLFEDVLGPDARDALRRLALLREEHAINGVAGPFGPGAAEDLRIDPETLSVLKTTGALGLRSADVNHGRRFAIPSILRDRAARRFSLVEADRARATRRSLAEHLQCDTVENTLEVHRQAVLSEDLDHALQTATYYATDLREIARGLSLRAERPREAHLYRQAAEVYHTIVDRFDNKDAYAWQYLAFNLERCRNWQQNEKEEERIVDAYHRSCALSQAAGRYNPLYYGRRLAFDLARGRPHWIVRRQLAIQIDRTRMEYGDEQVRWLVLPMKASGGPVFWRELVAAYPWIARLQKQNRDRTPPPEV